ncbi:MAG: hypothetical protein M1491_07780 [Deltaproteobacteria bacterium]|nr:hypothetical protein [Deltaproteobacteria bacterium]MCL5277915.1 hypothetical protein [Deltaproteobacteria bacterium]
MILFDKWLVVVLTTLNPLTGRGIAIPLGIGLGLPVVLVCVVSGISNFALASIVVLFMEELERIPVIRRFAEKKRGKRMTKFIEGKGLLYAVIFGPFLLGTFSVVLVFQALGADRRRMVFYSLLSSLMLTPPIAWISIEYKDLLQFVLRTIH